MSTPSTHLVRYGTPCLSVALCLNLSVAKIQICITQHTHTHPFNGPFSGTTWVSRYQKGKTNLDFTEARDSECQWHQLGHMQVCIFLQSDNHASTPLLKFFTGRLPFLPPNQQHQSTQVKHVHFFTTCLFNTYCTDFNEIYNVNTFKLL